MIFRGDGCSSDPWYKVLWSRNMRLERGIGKDNDYVRWIFGLKFCTLQYIITRELEMEK